MADLGKCSCRKGYLIDAAIGPISGIAILIWGVKLGKQSVPDTNTS